jgi:hypothetical protein
LSDSKLKNKIEEVGRLVVGHNRGRVIKTMYILADHYNCKKIIDLENLSDRQMQLHSFIGEITIRDIRTAIEYYYELKYEERI